MILGIFLTHGRIGQEILAIAESILGKQPDIVSLTNENLSFSALYDQVNKIIEEISPSEGIIIFVTLKGGSCWNVACKIAKERKGVKVISGVNLPMALSFFTKRDKYPLEDLAPIIERDALRGISLF